MARNACAQHALRIGKGLENLKVIGGVEPAADAREAQARRLAFGSADGAPPTAI